MKSLIATNLKKYGTRRLTAGDTFECSDEHAEMLIGMGKAKDPALEGAAKKPRAKPKTPRKRDGYRRRDMRPEA